MRLDYYREITMKQNRMFTIFKYAIITILSFIFSGINDIIAQGESTTLFPELQMIKVETIKVGSGVKSVILNPAGSKAYSINLEGMSVYEIDRESRKILRKLKFVPHPGKGFNYTKNVWINSYQEKPVEAHFTHNARYLWVSLHNANGIIVWDLQNSDTYIEGKPYKEAWLYERIVESPSDSISDTNSDSISHKNSTEYTKRKVKLLWINTGKTPKIITSSPDGTYLFVSNWHSNTVSIIQIESPNRNDWIKLRDLKTGRIPRGLAVSADAKYLYVAQMGGSEISVVALDSLKKIKEIKIGRNPRHLVLDESFMYVSLNMLAKLVKFDLSTDKFIKSVKTGRTPRTIALTKDKKIIFVVSYRGNALQAFSADDLKLLGSWKSSVHPVGVDVYQEGDSLEVWVANYSSGTINVFTYNYIHQ